MTLRLDPQKLHLVVTFTIDIKPLVNSLVNLFILLIFVDFFVNDVIRDSDWPFKKRGSDRKVRSRSFE